MFKFTKNKNYILAILLLILIFILIFKNDNNNIIIENFDDDDDESSSKVPCKEFKKSDNSNKSNKIKAFNSIQNGLISTKQNNNCLNLGKEGIKKNTILLEDRNN